VRAGHGIVMVVAKRSNRAFFIDIRLDRHCGLT
jgi:hypothetical protein